MFADELPLPKDDTFLQNVLKNSKVGYKILSGEQGGWEKLVPWQLE